MNENYSIYDMLPQRPPFLFLDKVEECEAGSRIVAWKYITLNEPYFQGHIPDYPYMPGSLILEMMVQAASALMLQNPDFSGRITQLRSVEKFSLVQELVPPAQCRIEVELKKQKKEQLHFIGKVLVDGTVVSESTFMFVLSEIPSKPKIHPTASIHPSAILGKDVVVGPNSVVGEHVCIGDRTVLEGNVIIEKWTRIGDDNHIYSGAVIGSQGQDVKYTGEEAWVVIGDRNKIREYVTINRSTGKGTETRIGSDCMLMIHSHVGHNCELGDSVIIANAVSLGGHVQVENNVVIGGMSGVHQFVRIGRGAMLGGYSRFTQDIPPFMLCSGNPAYVRGLNVVGLRRNKFSRDDIKAIKDAYKLLYRSEYNLKQALSEIQSLDKTKGMDDLLTFLKADTSRGISKKTEASES